MSPSGLLVPLPSLGGCVASQSPLNPAGAQADGLLTLFGLMVAICGVMYVLVLGFLGWGLWRGQRAGNPDRPPAVAPTDRGLARSLAVWSGIVVAGLTVLVLGSFATDRGLAGGRSGEGLEIRVTGHQWWWRIEYRDPAGGGWIETANELHLPLGRTARIALGSGDVIHSFWVPALAGKMDVIPGRANAVEMTPQRAGWFRGQCAEFCGVQHAHMGLDVKVETSGEFDDWLAAQARAAPVPEDPVLTRGMEIVTGGACAACHAVRGTPATGRPGPDLTHVGGRRSLAAATLPMSRGALQGWVAQPQALKPGTLMPAVTLAPADADAVARYLEWLR